MGLLALFGALHVLSAGGIAVDGDRIESAVEGEAGADGNADVLRDVTVSGADGGVNSFGSVGSGSFGEGDGTGVPLRVVTDEGTPSTVTSDPATTSVSASTAASTGATASETSPTTAPATASSPTAPVTTADTTSTSRRSSTTKAPTSSSSTTSSTATTATTATTSAPTTRPPTTSTGSGSNAKNFEQEVIRLTNEERSAGGCGPLTNNDKLHNAARGHSVDMAENDYFSHTSLDGSSMVDRIEREGYRWRSLAENIAAGHRSPAAVVEGWMNSSGHRANILNCDLTEIGVGFHNHYWTQNFGTPR